MGNARKNGTIEESIGADVREIMGLDVPDIRQDSTGKEKKKKNRYYSAISYSFVFIFLSLIVYLVWFNLAKREEILRSPYNNRKDALEAYVKRGDIVSTDGTVLAATKLSEDGESERVYPEGRVFAHVVGYDSHGKSGIENIENETLMTSDEDIRERIINDFSGQKNPGDMVVTTLDAALQKAAYEALGSYQGAIVAIDPDSGAVKALLSKPDFDPNTIASEWSSIVNEAGSSVLVNRATQGRYAPGSTFKIITTLALLRNGIDPESFHYECTGELTVGEYTVHCAGGTAHGSETLAEAFSNSCNCAFASIGLSLGADALKEAAESLLFNKSLPFANLSGNQSSFALTAQDPDAQLMQTAFGQGKTTVSPWHMALLVSAIAEDGMLMEPYLTEMVQNASGQTIKTATAKEYRRLFSTEEASTLRQLLSEVVENGSASALQSDRFAAYGKTGSAQFVRSDGTIGTHSWFVGYAEADGRKLAIAVLAEDAGSGSEVAVPIAGKLFRTYFE